MMEQQQNNTINERIVLEQFSPRKFLLQAGELFRYVLHRWYWPLLCGIALGAAAYFYYSFTGKKEYTAEITFVLDEEITSPKKSGLSEITEQLGLGPSDAGALLGAEGNFAGLLTSRFLTEQTLRQKFTGKKNITYIDFFLDSLNYRSKWTGQSPFATTKFDTIAKTAEEQLFQNSIIANAHSIITGKLLKIDKKMPGSSIIAISCTSVNELFSKMFLETLVKNAADYYVRIQTEKSKQNLQSLNHRLDSVRSAYVSAMYGKASISDANMNLVLQRAAVPGQKKQTDVDILRSAYTELSLNMESAKTALLRKTPVIQILDTPMLPLKTTGVSTVRKFILFFLLGAFLTAAFFFTKGLYKMLMERE
jgi:hypothetical protein